MRGALLPIGMLCVLAVACGDDPFLVRWMISPQESLIFTLDRPELNIPTAFNMLRGRTVVVEDPDATSAWDFAVERQEGQMMLLPPGALGVTSTAGIVPFTDTEFDDLRRAPADTLLYESDEPIPLDLGTIYVIRTHEQANTFGARCVYYGKLQPLEVDLEVGTFRFLHDTSPVCNDLNLVPQN